MQISTTNMLLAANPNKKMRDEWRKEAQSRSGAKAWLSQYL